MEEKNKDVKNAFDYHLGKDVAGDESRPIDVTVHEGATLRQCINQILNSETNKCRGYIKVYVSSEYPAYYSEIGKLYYCNSQKVLSDNNQLFCTWWVPYGPGALQKIEDLFGYFLEWPVTDAFGSGDFYGDESFTFRLKFTDSIRTCNDN